VGGVYNVYALTHGDDMLLVDTGRIYGWRLLRNRIEGLRSRAGHRALILTHSHFDHAENAARMKNSSGLKVIVHRSERHYLADGDSPLPAGAIFPTRWIMRLFGRLARPFFRYSGVLPDICVDERMDLEPFGFDGYILHTPGHTHGSMSVIVEDRIALVGDTLFGVLPGSVMPPYADDIPGLIKSWRNLLDTPCERFLPGHGREIKRALLERRYAKYSHLG
jgi:glyoxylase-like metal-dependent hydrolase (beta-lactamase superfamily II)